VIKKQFLSRNSTDYRTNSGQQAKLLGSPTPQNMLIRVTSAVLNLTNFSKTKEPEPEPEQDLQCDAQLVGKPRW